VATPTKRNGNIRFGRLLLLHQLNDADKAKTERKFIKEDSAWHTGVWRGFLTQRNFLSVEDWWQGLVGGAMYIKILHI
jgi:hypothetical protein